MISHKAVNKCKKCMSEQPILMVLCQVRDVEKDRKFDLGRILLLRFSLFHYERVVISDIMYRSEIYKLIRL